MGKQILFHSPGLAGDYEEPSFEELHPYRDLYPQRILRLSEVIEIQEEAADEVLRMNKNGMHPDENPIWRDPDWLAEYEPASDDPPDWMERARVEHHAHMSKIDELSNRRFRLHLLRLDCNMVGLGLHGDDEETKFLREGFTGPYGPHFVLLGEIAHMSGHVVVSRMWDGKMFNCIHDYCFYVLPPGEL